MGVNEQEKLLINSFDNFQNAILKPAIPIF